MEQHEQYRYIWMSGDQFALLAGIREHLRLRHGEATVKGLDRFIWNHTEIAVRSSPIFGVVITVPESGAEDANTWNEEFRNFYLHVVRPVADRTGGVTVGLAEPGALNPRHKT